MIKIRREHSNLLPPKNRSVIENGSHLIKSNIQQSNSSVNSQVQNNTDSNNVGYKANLIIRNDINGKKYLYDMIKIKRDTPETLTLANSNAAIRPEGISPIKREHPTLLPPKNRSVIAGKSLIGEKGNSASRRQAKSKTVIIPRVTLLSENIIQETSNKVNTQNEIKSFLKLSGNASTDIKTLQKENSYLKRKVESLKEEFKLSKGYESKSEDVDRMATRLMRI